MQRELREWAAETSLSSERKETLTAVVLRGEELTAKRYLAWVPTNAELARKYQISVRTVTNWRREGRPFAAGQTRVLGWLARWRYAPAWAREKFGKRLGHWKTRAFFKDGLAAMRADIPDLRTLHRTHGVPMDDWLRRMPFRAR